MLDIIKKPMLDKLQKDIGYQFKNLKLLETALIHSSYNNNLSINNERLEFLGDKIIGFILSHSLFKLYPEIDESILSKMIAYLGSKVVINKIAIELNLKQYIVCNSEDINEKMLSSACEALVAAIFLDCNDIEFVTDFITKYWGFFINNYDENKVYNKFNPKSFVQEWAQGNGFEIPKYQLLKVTGKEHEPLFYMSIEVANRSAKGKGRNKQEAQRDAANNFINIYKLSK